MSPTVDLVDSHCHLDDAQFDGDRDEAIARARAAGVSTMLAIGTGNGPPDLEAGIRLAERYEGFYATVGVHPHDAAKAGDDTFLRLAELAMHPKVVAIGEIGLDYHYDFSQREVQRRVFARQIEVASAAAKPVAIHTREAWDDTLAILRAHGAAKGIFHCFTGGAGEAEQALDLGFHLGFGGVVTFPKAENVREAARLTPDDRLLLETDCPYLAPAPHRGKRNEPAFLPEIARRLARVRGTTMESVAQLTTANFARCCLRAGPFNG